jgi:hypothetical protein
VYDHPPEITFEYFPKETFPTFLKVVSEFVIEKKLSSAFKHGKDKVEENLCLNSNRSLILKVLFFVKLEPRVNV